ncbi:MAG: MmcQ/YjbR family DNA-binding protein [Roseivirga sp.]
MNIEEYRQYCLSKKRATESIPFSKLPDVLVFKVMGKMFTATDISTFEPSYFSKKHWSQIIMDGTIPDDLLRKWLDISYNLVAANLPKKVRSEMDTP